MLNGGMCLQTESVKFRKEKNERHHRPFKSRVGCSVRLGPRLLLSRGSRDSPLITMALSDV